MQARAGIKLSALLILFTLNHMTLIAFFVACNYIFL